MSKNIQVITSVERRRRFSDEEKQKLVMRSLSPGANVSAIAREHGIAPSQLFYWRRLYSDSDRALNSGNAFVGVSQEPEKQSSSGEIYIHLGDEVVVELPLSICPRRLAEITTALRRSN